MFKGSHIYRVSMKDNKSKLVIATRFVYTLQLWLVKVQ